MGLRNVCGGASRRGSVCRVQPRGSRSRPVAKCVDNGAMDKLERLRETVTSRVEPLPPERLPLARAAGRWLAAPVLARIAAPPLTCSAMDGYALRASDVTGSTSLSVVQTVYAGDLPGVPLHSGEAARIFTGGPLPAGADTVVREEATRREENRVLFHEAARPGDNVRLAGEDVAAGGLALEGGIRLGARQLALCAAVGAEEVTVVRRPRAQVIATGDEILRGRTPNSNGAAVASLLRSLGVEVAERVVGDEVDAVAAALRRALAEGDVALSIGGVSIGERDCVPDALAMLGAEVVVHGVPMKPGKPFLFARVGTQPVFGLPGSPSACLVAFEVFARPAMLRLSGASRLRRRILWLPLAEPVSGRPGRARFLWARLEEDGRVRPIGRDAAQLRGPALADALLHVPEGRGELAAGERAEAWLLEDDAA